MKWLYRLTWSIAIAFVFLLGTAPASAHPLGNFTINHYAGLQVKPDSIGIDYVLDMAEIPAFQEINHLDTNRDRQVGLAEIGNYPADKCRQIQADVELERDRQPLPLTLNHSEIAFPPGVGGLDTLRLTCQFQGKMVSSDRNQPIQFADLSYPQRLGWREITVAAEDVPIQGDVTAVSITNRLTDYPTNLLSSPLNQRQISFEVSPPDSKARSTAAPLPVDKSVEKSIAKPVIKPVTKSVNKPVGQAFLGRNNDAFTRLITLDELNLPTMLVALAIAFVWGALHALSPGHGKTIVGAYLVGSRSKVHHALWLGLTVTLTHTAGIFALGLVMLGTSHFVLTEQVFPWLSALSGVLVTTIGLNLLVNRLRPLQVFQRLLPGEISPHAHFALATDHSHRYHNYEHHHHDHSHEHHSHEHHNHTHSHGLHSHSHLPPSADAPITWSSILVLGISGGILPCPSALVVLLSAIAIGRVGFGLALVSAFSLGLAGVLTAIGLMLVYTKHLFERLPQLPSSNLFPAVSALLITLMGIGITTQAFLTSTL